MNDKEYVQFSKRVTRWGLILISTILVACLTIVAVCDLPQYSISAIVSLYTSFATVLGVTVGAYQGNSSLEKWTRAKYNLENLMPNSSFEDEMNESSPNG